MPGWEPLPYSNPSGLNKNSDTAVENYSVKSKKDTFTFNKDGEESLVLKLKCPLNIHINDPCVWRGLAARSGKDTDFNPVTFSYSHLYLRLLKSKSKLKHNSVI